MKCIAKNFIVVVCIGAIAVACLVYCSARDKSDKFRLNNEMIHELSSRNAEQGVDAKLYLGPSREGVYVPVTIEFCEAIMKLYGKSAGNADASKLIQNYDALYLKITDHINNEYCVVKLHVPKDLRFMRIFPVANYPNFHVAVLDKGNDHEIQLIQVVLKDFAEQMRMRRKK